MEYEYPTLIADESMKRLHAQVSTHAFPEVEGLRKKCDFGQDTSAVIPFMEAVRLINEEGYRPCGNCLEEGGEVSNWKERAQGAEQEVVDLGQLVKTWQGRAEAAEAKLSGGEDPS